MLMANAVHLSLFHCPPNVNVNVKFAGAQILKTFRKEKKNVQNTMLYQTGNLFVYSSGKSKIAQIQSEPNR